MGCWGSDQGRTTEYAEYTEKRGKEDSRWSNDFSVSALPTFFLCLIPDAQEAVAGAPSAIVHHVGSFSAEGHVHGFEVDHLDSVALDPFIGTGDQRGEVLILRGEQFFFQHCGRKVLIGDLHNW